MEGKARQTLGADKVCKVYFQKTQVWGIDAIKLEATEEQESAFKKKSNLKKIQPK